MPEMINNSQSGERFAKAALIAALVAAGLSLAGFLVSGDFRLPAGVALGGVLGGATIFFWWWVVRRMFKAMAAPASGLLLLAALGKLLAMGAAVYLAVNVLAVSGPGLVAGFLAVLLALSISLARGLGRAPVEG